MATNYNVQIEDSEGNRYHPKPDLLTSVEQVQANTKSGKSVDALVVKELNNKLTSGTTFPNGALFYPDYQDGKYGFNTDPARGADTFHPFKKFSSLVYGVPTNLSKGDWVIIGGTNSYSSYRNMRPTNITGGNLIFFAESTGGYNGYIAIIEATTATVAFTVASSETKGVRACLRQ